MHDMYYVTFPLHGIVNISDRWLVSYSGFSKSHKTQ